MYCVIIWFGVTNNFGLFFSVVVKADKKLLTVLFPDGRDGRAFTLKVFLKTFAGLLNLFFISCIRLILHLTLLSEKLY